jgi:uncharacterized membrane protein YcfT
MVIIKRIIELDQIKGIAIIGVVLLHSVFTQLGHQPYLHSLWNIHYSLARYAADSIYFQMASLVMPLFVLVIGINFILQMNKLHISVFNKESLKRFYGNKLERIVFPVLILGAVEFALLRTSFSEQHLLSFVIHPVSGLGSHFIPFLLVFYFIAAPIVLWLYRKTGAWVILISLLLFPISYPIFAYASYGLAKFSLYDHLFYVFYWGPVVALGCAIGGSIVLTGGKLSIRSLLGEKWFALTLILGVVLFEAAFILAYPDVSNAFWYSVFPASIAGIVPFAILLPILQYFNNVNKRIFSFLAFFGKLSLEIYLVQMIYFSIPNQIILRDYVKALLGESSNTVASVGATFIVSLAIITLLALIAAYCLPKLFSFVKRTYGLVLKHPIVRDQN